jgi:hypothetical protein
MKASDVRSSSKSSSADLARPMHTCSFRRFGSGLLLGVLGLLPAALDAQAGPARAGTGAVYESYRFQDPDVTGIESLRLLTLPFAAAVPLPARSRIELAGAYAQGALARADGAESSIAGLTDTQLRLRIPLAGERVVLSGVAVLPTGIEAPSREEAEVAGVIASDLLPLRISHWGSGGGAGVGLSLAHTVGATGIGFGAVYMVSRSFDPIRDAEFAAYRPGDQLGVQLALNRSVGGAGKATLQLSMQRNTDDRIEGANLFRSGNRYQATGSYAFRVRRAASGIVYAGGQHREQGTALLELTRNTPSQDLLIAGGGLRIPVGRGAVFMPSADGRLFRAEDGIGQGHLGGLAATLEVSAGAVRIAPLVRVQFGSVLVRQGMESGLTGMDMGITVNLGSRRR